MNDKELADRIVALGVGDDGDATGFYYLEADEFDDSEFVRDWRVAGALMEKFFTWQFLYDTAVHRMDESISPREICEICVKEIELRVSMQKALTND